jgi:hypothetical protein
VETQWQASRCRTTGRSRRPTRKAERSGCHNEALRESRARRRLPQYPARYDALEPKIIRIGLLFGEDSRPCWRAIHSSIRLGVVLGILRGEFGPEILRPEYGPWWSLDAPRAALGESGEAQVAFREAATTEIRGAYLPLRRRDKAGLVDFRRRRLEEERDASPELLERLLKAREEARSSSAA